MACQQSFQFREVPEKPRKAEGGERKSSGKPGARYDIFQI